MLKSLLTLAFTESEGSGVPRSALNYRASNHFYDIQKLQERVFENIFLCAPETPSVTTWIKLRSHWTRFLFRGGRSSNVKSDVIRSPAAGFER